ncbi:MAG: hypothetical protein ACE5Q6_16360 [Dehalococcoidia bacterium]
MLFRSNINWQTPRSLIGCGTVMVLFGLLLLTPFIALLIKALGWFFIALGVIFAALGILTWTMIPRRARRDDIDRDGDLF